jgi:hypothetical protein
MVDKARRDNDSEIARLSESILARARRNTLAPIFKLPNEMLTTIFMDIVLETRDWCSIIPVTQVCQHWRQAAINYHLLWRYVDLSERMPLPPDIISRSEDTPLCVTAHLTRPGPTSPIDAVFEFINENMGRIEALDIAIPSGPHSRKDFTLVNPGPLLEAVRLDAEYSVGTKPFVPTFFHGHAPRLQKLALIGGRINWSWPILSQLTLLSVSYATRLDLAKTLSALTEMPRLRDLELEECLPWPPGRYGGESSTINKIVRLANLSKVNLSGTVNECAYFLDHVRFTPSTSLRLETRVPDEGLFHIHSLNIFQIFHNLPRSPCHQLQITCGFKHLCFATPILMFHLNGPGVLLPCFIVALKAIAETATFEELQFNFKSDFFALTEHDWSRVLQIELEHVTSITAIANRSGRYLLRALMTVHFGKLLLPKLRSLFLVFTEEISKAAEDEAWDLGRMVSQIREEMGVEPFMLDRVSRENAEAFSWDPVWEE